MKYNSAIMTEASGSVGGLVASHNRGGKYFRGKVVPVNANTARQQSVRSSLGAAIQFWTVTMTEPQRQAWRDYAAGTPVLDALGASIHLTGQNMFVRWTVPQLQFDPSASLLATAPSILNTGEPVTAVSPFQLTRAAGPPVTFQLDLNLAAPVSADGDVMVWLGRTQNPSRTFYKGPYQYAMTGHVAPPDINATIGPADTTDPTMWFADSIPALNAVVPIRIRVLYVDGRLSEAFDAMVPVAT